MNIGIIGAGNVGKALGESWIKHDHDVLFSYSRDLAALRTYAASFGPKACAGTPAEAVTFGDAVVFAPPWSAVDDALKAAGSLSGKVVIDCVNPLKGDLSGLAIGHTTSAAEELAHKATGARVVKAFNTTGADNMRNPQFPTGRATMFICGDDHAAKSITGVLARDIGFEVVDVGPLRMARLLEPMAMLWIHMAIGMKMGTGMAFTLLKRDGR